MKVRPVPFALAAMLAATAAAAPISGTVTDSAGKPIEGVRVRASPLSSRQVSKDFATTGADGRYSLETGLASSTDVIVTFSKPGYYTQGGVGTAGATNLGTALLPLETLDNPQYEWIPARESMMQMGCDSCHGDQRRAWDTSQHAIAAKDPLVLDLYFGTKGGTEVIGGPGFKLDFPNAAGDCPSCHQPLAALKAPGATPLSTQLTGAEAEGVTCEVCHKTRDVEVNTRPGVDGALRIWRPKSGTLFAFGPLDNVLSHPMENSYSPLHRSARLCSACHEYSNANGVPVMETYSEWAETAIGDKAYVCQDCHMRPFATQPKETRTRLVDNDHAWEMGGQTREPSTISRHQFSGALTPELYENAATLEVALTQKGETAEAKVTVANLYTGHALPTGMPFRNILLLVRAVDQAGAPLQLASGGQIPDYGGRYAGSPGKGFAKVLGDDGGNRNVPFWKATKVLEDTRVRPQSRDESTYAFQAPAGYGEVRVSAMLLYRRAFEPLADAKGWPKEDVLMERADQALSLTAPEVVPPPEVTPKPGCSCGAASPIPFALLSLWGLWGLLRRKGARG
ncbi:MAG: carboxypeptidase regulatory-like domain-containing protein [Myxococcales bacterium]|nr:carboxypeptidase regulatory-like domain-containing protein [Myxococcales bacterium]